METSQALGSEKHVSCWLYLLQCGLLGSPVDGKCGVMSSFPKSGTISWYEVFASLGLRFSILKMAVLSSMIKSGTILLSPGWEVHFHLSSVCTLFALYLPISHQ